LTSTADRRFAWPIAIVLLGFIVGWATLMSLRLTTDATDVPRYWMYGEAMRHGQLPYRDFEVEYPPGALIAFGLPALFGASYRAYRISFEIVMGTCGLGLIVATALAQARLSRHIVSAPLFVGAATLALGPITLGHFDLMPAFFVSAGLAALLWKRPRLSGALIGMAIATKIYAVVLVPLAVIWLWRKHGGRQVLQWSAATVVVIGVCFLPFVIASPGAVYSSVKGQALRPLQLESSAAVALLAAHQLISAPVGIVFSHSSAGLGGTSASLAATATVIAELVLLALIWITFVLRRELGDRDLAQSFAAAVLVFVTLGKVFSPQFLLWVVPLVALLGGTLALAGPAIVAIAVVLTRLYFPGRWRSVLRQEATSTWLLITRDVVLLALLAWLVASLVRKPTATSPNPQQTSRATWRSRRRPLSARAHDA
jgi:uncharacterized membrane protein